MVVFDKFMWGVFFFLFYVVNLYLEIVRGDILDRNFLVKYMEDCDVIIYFVVIVGYFVCEKFYDEVI